MSVALNFETTVYSVYTIKFYNDKTAIERNSPMFFRYTLKFKWTPQVRQGLKRKTTLWSKKSWNHDPTTTRTVFLCPNAVNQPKKSIRMKYFAHRVHHYPKLHNIQSRVLVSLAVVHGQIKAVSEELLWFCHSSLQCFWWFSPVILILWPLCPLTSTGETARVWRGVSRREKQRSSPPHLGYTGRSGRSGHPGHLQHTGHRAPHLSTGLHPHLAPIAWRRPAYGVSDPRIAACDPRVTPCHPGDANDPHDPRLSGGDEDGTSSPELHTPQSV